MIYEQRGVNRTGDRRPTDHRAHIDDHVEGGEVVGSDVDVDRCRHPNEARQWAVLRSAYLRDGVCGSPGAADEPGQGRAAEWWRGPGSSRLADAWPGLRAPTRRGGRAS